MTLVQWCSVLLLSSTSWYKNSERVARKDDVQDFASIQAELTAFLRAKFLSKPSSTTYYAKPVITFPPILTDANHTHHTIHIQTAQRQKRSEREPKACYSTHPHQTRSLHPHSIKPPKPLRRRPVPQLRRRDIPNIHLPLLGIPVLIVNNHPGPQQQRQHEAHAAESGGGGERGYVLRRVLVLEDVGADDTHEVSEGHGDRGEEDASAFVRDVVVVPLRSVNVSASVFLI